VDGKENYSPKNCRYQQAMKIRDSHRFKNITSSRVDVAKTNFIATISHELKTPSPLPISAEIAGRYPVGELTNEQKELISQLKNDNQRMLKILSELLEYVAVEAGKIQLNMQDANPMSYVQSSINAVSARQKKSISRSIKSYRPSANH